MSIKSLSPADMRTAVTAMETVEELRTVATDLGIKYSGNTGEGTLRTNIMNLLNLLPDVSPAPIVTPLMESALATPVDQVPVDPAVPVPAPVVAPVAPVGPKMDPSLVAPTKTTTKRTYTKAALMMMDPNTCTDKTLQRLIVRAKALRLSRVKISNLDPNDSQLNGFILTVYNKCTGKVSKYIPFGDESEHGYHIPQILLDQLRSMKFIMRKEIKGGQFGVKKYRTSLLPKFNIEILDPLTKKEVVDLASAQKASGAIDN